MEKKLRVLLVEDSIDDVNLIEHMLKKEGFSFSSLAVETKKDFEKQLLEFKPDVVISDHSLPQFNSMEALEIFKGYKREHKLAATFILVTGTVSEEFAVKAIQSGADDYILKDRLKRLPSAISNAVEKNKLKEQRRKIEDQSRYLLDILQKSLHEIYVFDPETLVFEYANEEALRNLGYTMEEMSKMTPADIFYDFDCERYIEMKKSVAKSTKGLIYERMAIRKDKTKYPVQIHMQLIQQGKSKKILVNLLDITEAKEHEQQKELALFIQNCFNENRSLEASLEIILKELCTRSSVSAGEVWSRDFKGETFKRYAAWNKNNEDIGDLGLYLVEKAIENGTSFHSDLTEEEIIVNGRFIFPDRFKVAGALPLKSGEEVAAVVVMYDCKFIEERNPFINLKEGVQDKLTANIRRKKTEEELQKIFELSPDILTILGKDGYVRKMNPALQKLLGYSKEEMFSMSFDTLIHPEDAHVLEEWKDVELQENEVAYFESRWLAKNGKYKCFSWSVTPYFKQELYIAIGRDVTQYKEQIKAISTQNEKLAEIAWEQSHVVRAPLTRLMACISYLETEKENHCKILKSIQKSAYELDEILGSIITKTEAVKNYEEY